MPRAMWDACRTMAASPLPGPVAVVPYLYGGSAGCPWPIEYARKVLAFPETEWALPIGVCRPADDPDAATDHWAAQAFALGAPAGTALCCDFEVGDAAAAVAAEFPSRFQARALARGYHPCAYLSASSSALIRSEAPSLDQWLAAWQGHEHTEPGAFAVQWDGGIGHAFDRSTVFDDSFPLWNVKGGAPPAPPNAGGTIMPFVKVLSTKTGNGYWVIGTDGGVESFGDAHFYGSMGGKHLAAPVVSGCVHPSGVGYWLVGADGGVFAFGAAHPLGSLGGMHLSAPITDIGCHPDGNGYWLLGTDGAIYGFGDSKYHGRAPA